MEEGKCPPCLSMCYGSEMVSSNVTQSMGRENDHCSARMWGRVPADLGEFWAFVAGVRFLHIRHNDAGVVLIDFSICIAGRLPSQHQHIPYSTYTPSAKGRHADKPR